MLASLRFVQGAVAKKDYSPELTHFHIEGGTVRGYNGAMALCHPIDLDLDVMPKAIPFIKAIQTCQDTVQLHVTPAGKLVVKSGKFKAFIDCIQGNYPEMAPEGDLVEVGGGLLKALRTLAPFISEDASRQWSRGILFRGGSAFATNNVVIVEHWLGYNFPTEMNIPRAAVLELLRIGEEPTCLQMSQSNVTFHFGKDKWLRTQAYTTQWPDVSRILDKQGAPEPVPEGMWDAIAHLKPFVNDSGKIYFKTGTVSTEEEEGIGASVEVSGLPAGARFHVEQIELLEKVVKTIDLTQYPAPCLFYGDGLRGAIVGMR